MSAALHDSLLFLVRVTSFYLVMMLVGSLLTTLLKIHQYVRYDDDVKLVEKSLELLKKTGREE